MTTSLQDGRFTVAHPPPPVPAGTSSGSPRSAGCSGANGHAPGPTGGSTSPGQRQPDHRGRHRHPDGWRPSAPGRRHRRARRPRIRRRGQHLATEVLNGRVAVRDAAGPASSAARRSAGRQRSPSTAGRLFISNVGPAAASWNWTSGGEPRVLCADVPMPTPWRSADGLLYFPVMGANEIWRIDPDRDGGPRGCRDRTGAPDRIRSSSTPGGEIVSTQAHRPGAAHRPAHRGENHSGGAVSGPGQPDVRRRAAVRLQLLRRDHRDPQARPDRSLLPGGFNWRSTFTVGADGGNIARRALPASRSAMVRVRSAFVHPAGYTRGLTASRCRRIHRHHFQRAGGPLLAGTGESEVIAEGFGQLWRRDRPGGDVLFAEQGTGRCCRSRSGRVEVLAAGLNTGRGRHRPGRRALVAERVPAGGRTPRAKVGTGGRRTGVVTHGVCVFGRTAVRRRHRGEDAGRGRPRSRGAAGSSRRPAGRCAAWSHQTTAQDAALLRTAGPVHQGHSRPDGTIFVSADAEGSVLAIRRRD